MIGHLPSPKVRNPTCSNVSMNGGGGDCDGGGLGGGRRCVAQAFCASTLATNGQAFLKNVKHPLLATTASGWRLNVSQEGQQYAPPAAVRAKFCTLSDGSFKSCDRQYRSPHNGDSGVVAMFCGGNIPEMKTSHVVRSDAPLCNLQTAAVIAPCGRLIAPTGQEHSRTLVARREGMVVATAVAVAWLDGYFGSSDVDSRSRPLPWRTVCRMV